MATADSGCVICFDQFRKPKVLPCGHSFCESCLIDWANQGQDKSKRGQNKPSLQGKDNSKEAKLSCPECRQECAIPASGIYGFPVNVSLLRADRKKCIDNDSKSVSPVCDYCNDTLASFRCNQCKELLCAECLELHGKIKRNRNHNVSVLSLDKSGRFEASFEEEYKECDRHKGKLLEFYCKTCLVLTCIAGTATEHKLHDCVTLDEHLIAVKESLLESIQNVESADKENDSIARLWQEVGHKMMENCQETKDQLKTHALLMHQEVDKLFNEKLRAIYDAEEKFNRDFDRNKQIIKSNTVAFSEATLKTKEIITSGTPHKIYSEYEACQHNLGQLMDFPDHVQYPKSTEFQFVAHEDFRQYLSHFFGDLKSVVRGHWTSRLHTVSAGVDSDRCRPNVVDVDIVGDTKLAVVDRANHTVKIIDNEEVITQSRIGTFDDPLFVCSSNQNPEHLLVVDNNGMRFNLFKWNITTKEKSLFLTENSCPDFDLSSGITVLGDQDLVLVTEPDNLRVHAFNLEGKEVYLMHCNGLKEGEMTYLGGTPGQTYFVINRKSTGAPSGLICYDFSTKVKQWELGPRHFNCPLGVCMLGNGDVLVADSGLVQVLLVSRQGREVEVVLSASDGLQEPTGLAYNPRLQLLAVADGSTGNILLFQYKQR